MSRRPARSIQRLSTALAAAALIVLPALAQGVANAGSHTCAAGEQPKTGEGESGCEPCPEGTYKSTASDDPCTPASPGNFVAGTGADAQTKCPAGTYQNESGKSSCIDAPLGYYTDNDGEKNPDPCTAPTYADTVRSTSCKTAKAGHFVNTDAAKAQTPCKAGTYQPRDGQTSCLTADIGYYVDKAGATAQTRCATVTTTGATSCPTAAAPPAATPAEDDAERGELVAAGTLCPPGTWSATGALPDGGTCTPASPGYFADGEGNLAQYPCEPGTYSPAFGAEECTPAEPGTYVPTSGASSTLPCPSSSAPGATTCGDTTGGSQVPDYSRFPETLILSQGGPLKRGDDIDILGTNFAPASPVAIWVSTFEEPIGEAVTDESGVLRTAVTLPRGMGTGDVVVIAIDATGVGQIAMLEVVGSPLTIVLIVVGGLLAMGLGLLGWFRFVPGSRGPLPPRPGEEDWDDDEVGLTGMSYGHLDAPSAPADDWGAQRPSSRDVSFRDAVFDDDLDDL